ncbi:hypothetical protein BC828DRAFT_388792 [Blastocladiella britannica]|nr:hypothetical protein BC828DRAFT_388792 [Blastocladiella britannica]
MTTTSCPSAPHSGPDLWFSVVLLAGIIVSYVPQQLKIVLSRSSLGLSPYFLLLGSVATISTVANLLLLQFRVVACCAVWSPLGCFENALGVVQVAAQAVQFLAIAALFLIYFPAHLKPRSSHSAIDSGGETAPLLPLPTDHIAAAGAVLWRLSKRVAAIVAAYFLLATVAVVAVIMLPSTTAPLPNAPSPFTPSPLVTALAAGFGTIATIMSCLQFLPQIAHTYHAKSPGALSIGTMMMQTPGTLLLIYSLASRPGTNVSSYLSYVVSATCQGTLLVLAVTYSIRNRRHLIQHDASAAHGVDSDSRRRRVFTYTDLDVTDESDMDAAAAAAAAADPSAPGSHRSTAHASGPSGSGSANDPDHESLLETDGELDDTPAPVSRMTAAAAAPPALMFAPPPPPPQSMPLVPPQSTSPLGSMVAVKSLYLDARSMTSTAASHHETCAVAPMSPRTAAGADPLVVGPAMDARSGSSASTTHHHVPMLPPQLAHADTQQSATTTTTTSASSAVSTPAPSIRGALVRAGTATPTANPSDSQQQQHQQQPMFAPVNPTTLSSLVGGLFEPVSPVVDEEEEEMHPTTIPAPPVLAPHPPSPTVAAPSVIDRTQVSDTNTTYTTNGDVHNIDAVPVAPPSVVAADPIVTQSEVVPVIDATEPPIVTALGEAQLGVNDEDMDKTEGGCYEHAIRAGSPAVAADEDLAAGGDHNHDEEDDGDDENDTDAPLLEQQQEPSSSSGTTKGGKNSRQKQQHGKKGGNKSRKNRGGKVRW